MKKFALRLKKRATELEISNAEAARRCELGERRYGNYSTGEREPDLATLVHIARSLETTPNELLGFNENTERDPRQKLLDRLNSAARRLDDYDLGVVVTQTEAIAATKRK